MPVEFGLNSLCSHDPVRRSHIARRGARSEGEQDWPKNEQSAPENREERQNQTQEKAQNDAGNDGKIERGMLALDPDIAGQST